MLTSEARSFSAGYDITVFEKAIDTAMLKEVDLDLGELQALGEHLDASGAVAAVFGHCLGAGLELALSCSTIVATAESKIGFPESRIGLLPAGRGLVLMRMQHAQSAQKLTDVALAIAEGRVTNSAPEAMALGYLRPSDVIVFLARSAAMARRNRRPLSQLSRMSPEWTPLSGPVTGMLDRALAEKRSRNQFTDYDVTIGERMKGVLVKSTSYEEGLTKERTEFVELLGRPFTQARIKHMREHGTPLRN